MQEKAFINKSNTLCFQSLSLSLMSCPFLHLLSSRGVKNVHFAATSTHRRETSAISTSHWTISLLSFPVLSAPFSLLSEPSLNLNLSHFSHLALSLHYAFFVISLLGDCTLSYFQYQCSSGFSHYLTGCTAGRAAVLRVAVLSQKKSVRFWSSFTVRINVIRSDQCLRGSKKEYIKNQAGREWRVESTWKKGNDSGGFSSLAKSFHSHMPTASLPICWKCSARQLCLGFFFLPQEDKTVNSDKVRNPNKLMRSRK